MYVDIILLPILSLTPAQQGSVFHHRWLQEYGRVFQFKMMFNVCTIVMLCWLNPT
jgi:hypothetical protein